MERLAASTGWKNTRNPVDDVAYTDASQVESCHADDGVSDLLSRAPMCLSSASRGRPKEVGKQLRRRLALLRPEQTGTDTRPFQFVSVEIGQGTTMFDQ